MGIDTRARARMVRLAEDRGGVVSRAEVGALGIDRSMVAREVAAGRVAVDHRALRIVGAPPNQRADLRRVLVNLPPQACLDGVTALLLYGLSGWDDQVIHVSQPKGARRRAARGIVAHELRSWDANQVVRLDGLRVTPPEVAAVRAAYWARSIRAAATILAMTAQQRLVPTKLLAEAAAALPRRSRAGLVRHVVDELSGGCESLSELDFAAECRRRGLPSPDRQVVLRRPSGRFYLDVAWTAYGLAVEIDGVQHLRPDRATSDRLKDNESVLQGRQLLRITTLAVWECDDRFYEQIRRALRAGGWTG
ncbi:type IV toxin-antitoxin system AbiEi family antitoxin domain-containing protein [Calidifontibacter terrae]